jgi:uncharacterized damage-inducible protein DinB
VNERQALIAQLYGVNSHKHLLHALEGCTSETAGSKVGRSPHTIFQILHHMLYWQDITLARLRGERPPRPASAALGWSAPSRPEDAADWEGAIACLAEGLRSIEALLADPEFDLERLADAPRGVSAREELLMLQGHNSYHLGQIVMLRQELGAWPPPRGGDTW